MSKYRIQVGNEILQVEVRDVTAHPVIATINGQEYEVWIQEEEGPQDAINLQAPAAPTFVNHPTPDPLAVAAQPRRMVAGGRTVRAPMPGQIIKVVVSAGDKVNRGDLLCVLEAMKMNNQIRAPHDGVIGQVATSEGTQVNYGDPLIEFE